MSNILRIIEKYQNLDDSILLSPDFAQDVQTLNELITNTQHEDKKKAIHFLESLERRIEDEVIKLTNDLKNKPDALEKIRQNTNACLAYARNNKDKKG